MEILREISSAGRCPILLIGLEGWPDAAHAASTAVSYILSRSECVPVYQADSDALYNYTVARPYTEIVDARVRKLAFPCFKVVKSSLQEKTLLVCHGHEPHRTWNKLIGELIEIMERHGVELVVAFGSMLDDVSEIKVSAVVSIDRDSQLVRELGVDLVQYSGPCCFYTPLVMCCSQRNIRCICLWAHVPLADYYEVLSRYNIVDWRATLALLEKFTALTEIELDLSEAYHRANEVEFLVRRVKSKDEEAGFSKYLL